MNHVLRITKIGVFSWKNDGDGWASLVNISEANTFELSCVLCDYKRGGHRTDRTGPLEEWHGKQHFSDVKNPTYCVSTYF